MRSDLATVCPEHQTVPAAMDKAIAAAIKFVPMNSPIPDWAGKTAPATTNNFDAGKSGGAYLKSMLKSGDTLVFCRVFRGGQARDVRVNGTMVGLRDAGVTVVGNGATHCTEKLAISVAKYLLTKNPDLKAIYAPSASRLPVPPVRPPMQALPMTGSWWWALISVVVTP